MPKVYITWNDRYDEWLVWDKKPDLLDDDEVVECEMNASLYRQIKAAEKKYEKFQDVLEKFYSEGVAHPGTVRRVK